MGRRVALLLSVLLLLATGCDGDPPGRGGPAPGRSSASASPVDDFDPPAGQRWAGRHRVVVAVPEDWRSIDTPICQTPPTHTVVYFNRLNLASSCPFMGFLRHQRASYLSVQPEERVTRADRRGKHLVDLDGTPAYAWNHPHAEYGQSAGILIPSQHVALFIHTPRKHLARRIIHSATVVPRGFQVVPPPAYASRHLENMMQRLRDHGFRPTYVEGPPGLARYGYPGHFLRTDPPIGSALPRGSRVTAYFSAGSLGRWITPQRLAAQGWRVGPPTSDTPRIDRDTALARLDRGPNERAAFLRTLTIDGRTHQAWLVVVRPHYPYPGQAVTVSVVGARSGRVLLADVSFPATR